MSKKKEEIPSLDEMNMRDLFAFFALQGFCANPTLDGDHDHLARSAYAQADAMLKERSK